MSASPRWGCDPLGFVPGISFEGTVNDETQTMTDGLSATSSFCVTQNWSWNLATDAGNGVMQYLTKDFIFITRQRGNGAVDETR